MIRFVTLKTQTRVWKGKELIGLIGHSPPLFLYTHRGLVELTDEELKAIADRVASITSP